MIEVVRAGALTTVQDRGRPGWAHLGVPRAGALDQPALALANRIVGNQPGAAALEMTLTGCTLRFPAGGRVALTGAPARLRVAGRPAAFLAAVAVPAGAVVEVGPIRYGVRGYLAVAGGIAVTPVLGSRATDTLAGIGPPPLRDGDLLPVGTAGTALVPATDPVPWSVPAQSLRLTVRLGPRQDWFTEEAIRLLLGTAYTVSPVSNRVAARLTGTPLARSVPGELPSEGLVLGAVQVPADGQPLIFLADHPTTGGYPVIAVVDDVTALAQARPGTTVEFHGPQRGPG
ncbi:biotin-dependent carboxyltransferase family protein [Solwaraspora sp. WMMB335]|uniref:5-oxoprolinase subunit C family protein n=1 Tax=Solwaraspora sp. WMMB335 TaxID=3404118 RepID=UPI003B9277F5